MLTATIFDLVRSSFVDGPGIRTSVFFKGCNLRCAWCHNPEGLSPKPQLLFYKNKCKACGKCAAVCPNHMETCTLCGICAEVCPHDARKLCGREITVDTLFREIKKDRRFYDASGGGVTFSGGECMLRVEFLTEILRTCHEAGIHTAVDTAGNVPFAHFEKIFPYTDLFLYDIKLMDPILHKRFTGVDNRQILENLTQLFNAGAHVWIRIPVIQGVNADEVQMRAIRDFLAPFAPEKIDLLPYHAMGENKYEALGTVVTGFSAPDEETMDKFRNLFQ